jgi:hypothetical protein
LFGFDHPDPGRREPEHRALVVKLVAFAVDPAEAQRLFDRLLVRYAGLAGGLFVRDQPNARRVSMVLLQPLAPLSAGQWVDGLG